MDTVRWDIFQFLRGLYSTNGDPALGICRTFPLPEIIV